jgi:hypothetical protein
MVHWLGCTQSKIINAYYIAMYFEVYEGHCESEWFKSHKLKKEGKISKEMSKEYVQ